MLWFFRKQNARVQYQIRRQSDGDDFELVITREDGREQIEKFADARAVVERSQLLHDSLIASGWRPPDTAGTSPRDRDFQPHRSAAAGERMPRQLSAISYQPSPISRQLSAES